MKKTFLFLMLAVVVIFSSLNFISAQELNYSVNYQSEGIQVSSLKYEPYPVNPGEYFDVWIKVNIGTSVKYAKFELLSEFPFSLDDSSQALIEYENFAGDVILHYKVRVDKNAVEAENPLRLKISTSKLSDSGAFYPMNINVANAQTYFDLVVQDSTTSDVSLAIANIGKNTANSMIVRIPQQDSFRVTGTNGQMVGNLDAGDYSLVSFSLVQVGRSTAPLIVQIDYTDSIGERRSVLKEISFNSQSLGSANVSATGMPANFTRNFPGKKKAATWPYIIAGILILISAALFVYFKYFGNKRHILKKFKDSKKDVKNKTSEIPDWIKKVKEKEGHALPRR